jgi:hypothetical protein
MHKMKLTTVLLIFLFYVSVSAQIFVNQDATGSNDGSAWTNAFTNLQSALDAATPGNQLWIAAGTYIPEGPSPDSSPFWALKEVHLYGGFFPYNFDLNKTTFLRGIMLIDGMYSIDDSFIQR